MTLSPRLVLTRSALIYRRCIHGSCLPEIGVRKPPRSVSRLHAAPTPARLPNSAWRLKAVFAWPSTSRAAWVA
jgi:hypothetical protein